METLAGHPYIVTLHAAFQSHDALYFVMDFCEGEQRHLNAISSPI